jgi:hypothetical protein
MLERVAAADEARPVGLVLGRAADAAAPLTTWKRYRRAVPVRGPPRAQQRVALGHGGGFDEEVAERGCARSASPGASTTSA